MDYSIYIVCLSKALYIVLHAHAVKEGSVNHARQPAARQELAVALELELGVLLRNTSTPGIEPITFWLADKHSTSGASSYCRPVNPTGRCPLRMVFNSVKQGLKPITISIVGHVAK